jgi:hypothetical protein
MVCYKLNIEVTARRLTISFEIKMYPEDGNGVDGFVTVAENMLLRFRAYI